MTETRDQEPEQDYWDVDDVWRDGDDGHVRHVYIVRGPEPFGGLETLDRDQAQAVADSLNLAHGREVPPERPREPGPPTDADRVAASLGTAMAERGLGVEVNGATIRIGVEPWLIARPVGGFAGVSGDSVRVVEATIEWSDPLDIGERDR